MKKRNKILLLIAIVCIFLGVVIIDGIKINSMKTELEATKSELSNYTIDESEIAPCPFCDNKETTLMDLWGDGSRYCVECNNCHASGPIYYPGGDYNRPITKQEAVELWSKASK